MRRRNDDGRILNSVRNPGVEVSDRVHCEVLVDPHVLGLRRSAGNSDAVGRLGVHQTVLKLEARMKGDIPRVVGSSI